MKVYLVRAQEWNTDVDCVCATEELALRECKRLADEYGLEDDMWELGEEIAYDEFELIEE